MKILIKITTDSELISYEALSLAFLLASFDHSVQVYFDNTATLADSRTRSYGMVQSFMLYDMPTAWVNKNADLSVLDDKVVTCLTNAFDYDMMANRYFDSVWVF